MRGTCGLATAWMSCSRNVIPKRHVGSRIVSGSKTSQSAASSSDEARQGYKINVAADLRTIIADERSLAAINAKKRELGREKPPTQPFADRRRAKMSPQIYAR